MEINKNNWYLVRGVQAGVFFGHIINKDNGEVTMGNATRIWYWEGANSLSQLAEEGTKEPNNCKFSVAVDECLILGVCEILKCSAEAIKSIQGVKVWKQ